MRLLGARVEVEGDPSRATPRPGERAEVSFVAVHPTLEGVNDTVQTMLVSCTQPGRYTGGVPVCQEFLDAALGGAVDVQSVLDIAQKFRCLDIAEGFYEVGTVAIRCIDGDPSIPIRVAPSFEADELLYRGIVCEDGNAYVDPFDPLLFGCDRNEGETFRVHGTVTVQHDAADANHNPSLADAELLLGNPGEEGGRAWDFVAPEAFPAEDDCWEGADAAGLLRADSFGNHQITVRYDASAREEVDGEPEDVEISLFATAGELGQRFVLFDAGSIAEDGIFEDTVSWTPPLELESRSQIVRFFFTVLDRRGGFDWTTRAICLR